MDRELELKDLLPSFLKTLKKAVDLVKIEMNAKDIKADLKALGWFFTGEYMKGHEVWRHSHDPQRGHTKFSGGSHGAAVYGQILSKMGEETGTYFSNGHLVPDPEGTYADLYHKLGHLPNPPKWAQNKVVEKKTWTPGVPHELVDLKDIHENEPIDPTHWKVKAYAKAMSHPNEEQRNRNPAIKMTDIGEGLQPDNENEGMVLAGARAAGMTHVPVIKQ